MDKLLEFTVDNWLLVLALVGVVAAIIANEAYLLIQGRSALDPDAATRLYNQENAVFVDVRGENAYASGHLPAAVHAPQRHLEQHHERLQRLRGRPVIAYAEATGAVRTVAALRALGLEPVYHLRGGFTAWRDKGLPTEGRS